MGKETIVKVVNKSKPTLGLGGILTIIFVIAKIGGYIDWSWWWVFAPLWIPAAIGILFFLGMLLTMLVVIILASIFGR